MRLMAAHDAAARAPRGPSVGSGALRRRNANGEDPRAQRKQRTTRTRGAAVSSAPRGRGARGASGRPARHCSPRVHARFARNLPRSSEVLGGLVAALRSRRHTRDATRRDASPTRSVYATTFTSLRPPPSPCPPRERERDPPPPCYDYAPPEACPRPSETAPRGRTTTRRARRASVRDLRTGNGPTRDDDRATRHATLRLPSRTSAD